MSVMIFFKKLAIYSVLVAGFSSGLYPEYAFAQSSSNKKSTTVRKGGKSVKQPDANDDRYREGVSLADGYRGSGSNSKYLLATLGLSPQPLIGGGGAAGFTTASGNAWEASLNLAKGKKGNIEARVIQAVARYRLSMFGFGYAAFGGGFRTADGAWNVLSVTSFEYETSSSLNAVTFDSAIGASTKMGSFLIEADVLGISYPIFKLGVKKSSLTQDDVDKADEAKQQKDFDSIGAGLNITLMKAGIGFSF
jgi:hypothetical protein